MMAELKTLEKKDPQFVSYLMGTFSSEIRAIPVTSLNVATENESITFELKKISEVKAPAFLKKWAQILKLQNLLLALFPIFLVLTKNIMDQSDMDYSLAVQSALGAIFMLLAVSLRNDVKDHISGLDRIQPKSGSRGIQEGWITAAQAQSLSNILFGLAVLAGLPSLIIYPKLILIVSGLALVGIWAMVKFPSGLKYRSGVEVAVFFLLGPLLTVGYEISIGGRFDLETIFFGVVAGWFAVFIFHLKNFESILISNQAGFENSITKKGFEKGRRLLMRWWIGFVALLNFYQVLYGSKVWSFVFVVVSFVLSWALLKKFEKVKSPVSSSFSKTIQSARSVGFILIGLWVIENLSYLLALELGR